jgi:hypothetical protein
MDSRQNFHFNACGGMSGKLTEWKNRDGHLMGL